MLQSTIISSGFNSFKYLNQYLFGISQLKSISDQVDITLAFGSVSDTYDESDHQNIKKELEKTCNEAGISLHFYVGKKEESFYQTANILIAQTIGFTENYATWNIDDLRLNSTLLEQIKTLNKELITYSDYICTNDILKCYEAYQSGDLLKYKDIFCKVEETWPEVDMSNREKYYREFRWSCFMTFKAQVVARLGVFSEEFQSSGDFDLINRFIFHGIRPVKTPGIGGFFLNVSQGLSTKPDTKGHAESYKILQRYLGNQHPVATFYGKKCLWRNL